MESGEQEHKKGEKQITIIDNENIVYYKVQKSEDLEQLQELVYMARKENKRIIIPISQVMLTWLSKNPRSVYLDLILLTNSSSGDYPITSLEQLHRDFKRITSYKFGANVILNVASMLKYASRFETNEQIRYMKHIISQISKRCVTLNLYDRNQKGDVVQPFKGYLFKILPDKTASILYLHCLNEFSVYALRFQYTQEYVKFLKACKQRQFEMCASRVYVISKSLITHFFRTQTHIDEVIQSDSEVTVEVQNLYVKVCDHVETLQELQSQSIVSVITRSAAFDKYNISKDIYPYIALAYDPIFTDGYVYKDAMDTSSFDTQLFNCVCGQVYPIAEFMDTMRSEKLQQVCSIIQRPGVTREECDQDIKLLSKHIIPFDFKLCGAYQRNANQNIKKLILVTSRANYDAIRQRINNTQSALQLTNLLEHVNDHQFYMKNLKIMIVYYQSHSESVIMNFRYNCAVPFWLRIKNIFEQNGIEITRENMMFDLVKNVYIEVDKELDIFTLVGLQYIPVQYRVGGFISKQWFQQQK